MDTIIEGYFHSVKCPKCNTRFYPLRLNTNAGGKIPLISNRELYCTVGELTNDEKINTPDAQRIAERISLQKMRRDLVHCQITKFVVKESQRYSPGFEPGIYYHCIHCDEVYVKSNGEISFVEYVAMGGKIDFNYAMPSDAKNKWKLLRNYGITFLVGALMLASVLHNTGWLGDVVGGSGILLMLISLGLLNRWIQTNLKGKDEDDRNAFNPEPLPALEKQYDNQAVTRRIKWISGLFACAGISLILLDKRYIHLSQLPALYFPIIAMSFFAIIIYTYAKEEGTNYDLGWLWKNDPRLRAKIWLSGAGMLFGMLATSPFANSSLIHDWEWIPGIVLFFTSAVLLVVLMSRKMKKPAAAYQNWNKHQKKLDTVFIILPLSCFILLPVLGTVLMDNIIHELRFCVIFLLIGILPGYLLINFFKTHFTELFQKNTEARWSLELRIYLITMLATLWLSAAYNRQTAWNSSNYKTVKLVKRDEHKIPIEVEYDGRVIRLYPGNEGWKAIAGADSVRLRVGTGALGFEHVLEIGR
ncbi:MAG: hypothetical protein WCR52_03210 [Bacteroidota bacterium]|uniref:hypothetical protein n=1 Tax=Runella sp. TaxID=1960881 RepID=UPI00301B6A4E